MLSNVRQGSFQRWKQVVSNIGKEWCQILYNSIAQRLTRVLSGVRTYKLCIGGYSGWTVSVMATADGWWSKGGRKLPSQRNRPHM